jgi:hypothetical protein
MTTTWSDGNVITNTFMNQAQRRIEAVAHVEDPAYGAVGDGVTDDTAAIQAAFEAAETVMFRAGATYKVASTLYLSRNNNATAVKRIQGNGATINFVIAGSTTSTLSTMQVGIAGVPTDTSASGEYSGWQGTIEDLNFTTSSNIVMMYLFGSGGTMRNCSFVASGTSVVGCVVTKNLINWTFDKCFFDMRSVMTDTTGSGSYTADVNGDNVPSSFCIMNYARYPGQTLNGQVYTSSAPAYHMDGYYVDKCVLVGGYVGLFFPGGDSHTVNSVTRCEFAYMGTGIVAPTFGTISDSWFENILNYGIRVVGASPPWHTPITQGGIVIESCSFSPHNTGTSKSIAFDTVAYGCSVRNCSFIDSLVNVYSNSTTNNHLWLVGGYKSAGADDFSAATLKIHYQNWMGDTTYKFPDDVYITTAGKGLRIKEGSNARMGTSTLVAGTIVVANTSITASSRVFVSRMATGGTAGHLSIVLNAGVGFTINSSSGTDTSTVAWFIMEPA